MLEGESMEGIQSIGLLDIFGFEKFENNFFEQLCINFTNEKLHKLYISATFDSEKAELTDEGLEECIENLKYPDNTGVEVIYMLEGKKPPGLFNLVDDLQKSGSVDKWEQLMNTVQSMHGKNEKMNIDFK